MIKQAALTGILVLLVAFLFAACAPTNDTINSPSASQSGSSVPGEKLPDDQRYGPGPMGSGNVRW